MSKKTIKDTGYSPPIDPQSTDNRPNYQVVFYHDELTNLFRILLPGYADNGTYYLIVENHTKEPIHCQVNLNQNRFQFFFYFQG